MKSSFWRLIWSSFWEIQGFWIAFLSLTITIILAIFVGKTPVSLYWLLIIVIFGSLIIATLFKALNKLLRNFDKVSKELDELSKEYEKLERNIFPKIIVARKQSNTEIWLLLEASAIFSNDIFISFFYTDDDGYECFIALG